MHARRVRAGAIVAADGARPALDERVGQAEAAFVDTLVVLGVLASRLGSRTRGRTLTAVSGAGRAMASLRYGLTLDVDAVHAMAVEVVLAGLGASAFALAFFSVRGYRKSRKEYDQLLQHTAVLIVIANQSLSASYSAVILDQLRSSKIRYEQYDELEVHANIFIFFFL